MKEIAQEINHSPACYPLLLRSVIGRRLRRLMASGRRVFRTIRRLRNNGRMAIAGRRTNWPNALRNGK
jgi:hypothetical protein